MGVDAVMIVRVKRPIANPEIREVAYDLVEAFGTEPFMITAESYSGKQYRALDRLEIDEYTIQPEPGETLLDVSLYGRYYGEGYERGNLPVLIAIASFLERRLRSDVWYGGDTEPVEPFPASRREELFLHFIENGHKPYVKDWGPGLFGPDPFENPVCEFCNRRTMRFGRGANGKFGSYVCRGCGWALETHDGGLTWKVTATVGGQEVREAVAK